MGRLNRRDFAKTVAAAGVGSALSGLRVLGATTAFASTSLAWVTAEIKFWIHSW